MHSTLLNELNLSKLSESQKKCPPVALKWHQTCH